MIDYFFIFYKQFYCSILSKYNIILKIFIVQLFQVILVYLHLAYRLLVKVTLIL